jgi:2-haloacid dehalogenase
MLRRRFLHFLSGAAVSGVGSACTPGLTAAPLVAPAAPRARIRAVCFDLFTLFDPRSVVAVARSIVPNDTADFCEAWRSRQFQYAFLRAAGGQYIDFQRVTEDALLVAARAKGVTLSTEERARLVGSYSALAPWPDARAALTSFRRRGLRLAPLTNYSPAMLEALLARAAFTDLFDAGISTDAARTFKPDPRAYGLGPTTLGLRREEIAFSAFGGWDAAGAKWFGYPTFWVNRLGVPREELGSPPDAEGPTLSELATFVSSWA